MSTVPVYLSLPLKHRLVATEPLLGPMDLSTYLKDGLIDSIAVGGESGPQARPCDYDWVLDLHTQCVENNVGFYYHQTGAKLIKDGKEFFIPRKLQHSQAQKRIWIYVSGTTVHNAAENFGNDESGGAGPSYGIVKNAIIL